MIVRKDRAIIGADHTGEVIIKVNGAIEFLLIKPAFNTVNVKVSLQKDSDFVLYENLQLHPVTNYIPLRIRAIASNAEGFNFGSVARFHVNDEIKFQFGGVVDTLIDIEIGFDKD